MTIPLTCPNCSRSWDYKPSKPNPYRRYAHCPICGFNVKLPKGEKQ